MAAFIISALPSLDGKTIGVWKGYMHIVGIASILKQTSSTWLIIVDSQGHQYAIHQDDLYRYQYELLDN